VRVQRILHDLALPPRGVVHAARRRNVALAVESLLTGQRASLTAIGRGLARRTSHKHRIKRVDRLLANPHLEAEAPVFYRALIRRVLGEVPRPIFLIDWTMLGKHVYALVVAVPVEGRAIPILVETVGLPVPDRALRTAERTILRKLRLLIPHDARPILVGDAGFRSRFIRDVAAMNWDVLVRLRGQTHVRVDGRDWTPVRAIFAEATRAARDLGTARVAKQAAVTPCRLVLGPRRRRGPSRRRWYPPKRGAACGAAQKSAREPWLLATTITDLDAGQLVDIYARRMRIEETFRDAKCARYGWSLDTVRSRQPRRFAALFLLVAIAMLTVTLLGFAAEQRGLHRRFQANTTTHRRVLSWFALGCHLVRRNSDWAAAGARVSLSGLAHLLGAPA